MRVCAINYFFSFYFELCIVFLPFVSNPLSAHVIFLCISSYIYLIFTLLNVTRFVCFWANTKTFHGFYKEIYIRKHTQTRTHTQDILFLINQYCIIKYKSPSTSIPLSLSTSVDTNMKKVNVRVWNLRRLLLMHTTEPTTTTSSMMKNIRKIKK